MSKNQANSQQKAIINHIKGAVLVLATVGSGKTRVLSSRVFNAINKNIPAEKILCLTFTNRAAQEMRNRLQQFCPENYPHITIKTFHSLCTFILRIDGHKIGLSKDFMVYDNSDCQEIIKTLFNLSEDKKAQQIIKKILLELAECKINSHNFDLSFDVFQEIFSSFDKEKSQLFTQYQHILQERQALDFTDLVYYVRSLFYCYPETREKWQEKYEFIQVDEVQDTHLSEYEIISNLAVNSRNLALIGDLDQTIYEWRGSQPEKVISKFKKKFNPVEYELIWNYRATQTLLNTASDFAQSFDKRYTKIKPDSSCEKGELITIYQAKTETDEATWIAKQIQKLADNQPNFDYKNIAILARFNQRIETLSQPLKELKIPCVSKEEYQFFQQEEIKDSLAFLRLIINPFDTAAMKRILLKFSKKVKAETINYLVQEGEKCGLRLTDFASTETLKNGEPFKDLLTAYHQGIIVIFDVETTGLLVRKDELIEIAAIKLINGQEYGTFHEYITNNISVGESEKIHHYTDEFLAEKGKPAREVLQDFLTFAEDAVLIGHNISFDLKMLRANCHKLALQIPNFTWFDTLNLAHRFIESDNYRLETLAPKLNLKEMPNHHALTDTQTTVELLHYLIPEIKKDVTLRKNLVEKYGKQFTNFAKLLDNWKKNSEKKRPHELLKQILVESDFRTYYQNKDKNNSQKLQNLKTLIKIFETQDNSEFSSDTSLRNILEDTALAKNIDVISTNNNQVMIMTVHQAKGLEFDTVFIAGISEGEFPAFSSVRDGKEEEEKRLFYVALTRAKKRLFISYYALDSNNFQKSSSKFLNLISSKYSRKIYI